MPINRRNRKFPGEVDPPPTEDETVFTEVPSTSRSEVDPILQTEETEGHEDIEPPSHSVEKVRKKFKFKKSRLETRPFWTWSEVKEGMMVYLKYYGFWHAVLVTQVIENLSKIRGIHYAVGRTIFHSRVVKEDDFVVNLDRNELWEARIPEVVRRPIPETIELAHGLIGETNFNMFTRRSGHFVLECILKEKPKKCKLRKRQKVSEKEKEREID